jgi:hypothetical protein
MSYFYAGIQGQAGPATRMGSKNSGINGFVQSHDARLQVGMDSLGDEDHAYFTLAGGYSSYSSGRLTLSFPQVNSVVNAIGQGDKKIDALVERIQKDIQKLNDEAPAALKRIERRQKIETNKRFREYAAREARLNALRETITDAECDNYMRLVMELETEEERERWYPAHNRYERVKESIINSSVEPYRRVEDGALIVFDSLPYFRTKQYNLTSGEAIEDKEEAA